MKFRVWYNGKMWLPGGNEVNSSWFLDRNGKLHHTVIQDKPLAEVMFSSGRLDMNRVEMFEGDIYNYYQRIDESRLENLSPGNVLILADFLGGHYWIENHGVIPVYEVIGNKFETPGLIQTYRGFGCREEGCCEQR